VIVRFVDIGEIVECHCL